MNQPIGQTLAKVTPGIRRAIMMLLAVTYVFVGVMHTVSCANEAVAVVLTSDAAHASGNGSHDGDSNKSPLIAESCHVWMPIVMPPLLAVAAPSTDPRQFAMAAPTDLLAGHSRLDTPPPKYLI